MSKLPTKHEGQFKKKSQKGSNGSKKSGGRAGCENSQPAKFRNLQNSAGCESSQPSKIYAVGHFSSVCGSNFLPTSVVSFEFGLDFSCLD